MFNISLSTGLLPASWKKANIVPVFKSGEHEKANNYRPISLLTNISKVLERVVYNRMYAFLKSNNLLSLWQSGFRDSDNTVYQLIRMYNDWTFTLDKHQSTGVIFLDLRKAFDRVWHQGLLSKLHNYGFQGSLHTWLTNYLTGRQQRVVINGQYSEWKTITAGVPQGSILGPLMFLVYINDLPEVISSNTNMFADDTSIYCTGDTLDGITRELQTSLTSLEKWFNEWGLEVNATKTKVMYITNKKEVCNLPLKMNQTVLEAVNTHKHLGVILSNNLKWSAHIDHVKSKTNKMLGLLQASSYNMPRSFLLTAYKSIIRPSLEYASPLWAGLGVDDTKRLDSIQYRACMIATRAMKCSSSEKLRQDVQVDTLSQRRDAAALCVLHRMVNDEAPPHLISLKPEILGDIHHRDTRGSCKLKIPKTRLVTTERSFIPRTLGLWNSMPISLTKITDLSKFKTEHQKLKLITPNKTVSAFRDHGKIKLNALHTRLRLDWCGLNTTLYKIKISQSKKCDTCGKIESVKHFLMDCSKFSEQRKILTDSFKTLIPDTKLTLNLCLNGSPKHNIDTNKKLATIVQQYIEETKRFM